MKKRMISASIILTLFIASFGTLVIPNTAKANSLENVMQKSIYFGGTYTGKMKSGGNGGKATVTFTVKKKKVVVKQFGKKLVNTKYKTTFNFSGTYKVKAYYCS